MRLVKPEGALNEDCRNPHAPSGFANNEACEFNGRAVQSSYLVSKTNLPPL